MHNHVKIMKKLIILLSISIYGWIGWWTGSHFGLWIGYWSCVVGSIVGGVKAVRFNQNNL